MYIRIYIYMLHTHSNPPVPKLQSLTRNMHPKNVLCSHQYDQPPGPGPIKIKSGRPTLCKDV